MAIPLHRNRRLVVGQSFHPRALVANAAHKVIGGAGVPEKGETMARKDLVTDLGETSSVPAWKAIEGLGYKPELFLASEDKERGVVLLAIPTRPGLMGIAWWSGADWQDPARLRAQIKWSKSPLVLLSWATLHPIVSAFQMLTHWLHVKVRQTAN